MIAATIAADVPTAFPAQSSAGPRPTVAFIHQPWSVVTPPVDGADSIALWTDEVARRLSGRFDIVCYCRRGPGQPARERIGGVEYRRVSVSIDRWLKAGFAILNRHGVGHPRRPFFASDLCYRQFIRAIAADLRHEPRQIVHIHNFSQFIPHIRHAVPSARIILHMHCHWLTQLDPVIVAPRLRQADMIVGVSDALARTIQRQFPDLAHRCRRIYNGANLNLFTPPAAQGIDPTRARRILYVGRLSPEKGIHVLIEAFARVLADFPEAHLHLAGPDYGIPYEMIAPFRDDPRVAALSHWYRGDAYGRHLRQLLRSLPPARFTLDNRDIPHHDLPAIYRSAGIFVFPSIWQEPFGMPVVEAMACGLPVVATRVGAFPELIREGHTGLLADPASAPDLAKALGQMLTDPSRSAAMGTAAARQAHASFGWDTVARNVAGEYARLVLKPA